MTVQQHTYSTFEQKRHDWFEAFLHDLTTDQTLLNLGMASKETEEFYNKLVLGDSTTLSFQMREMSSKYFIRKLVVDYITEIKALQVKPLKLALDYTGSQVLVWAEIEDNDEATEIALYKAEAKANAKNYQFGFHISSTILEKSDGMPMPTQYESIMK